MVRGTMLCTIRLARSFIFSDLIISFSYITLFLRLLMYCSITYFPFDILSIWIVRTIFNVFGVFYDFPIFSFRPRSSDEEER